MSNLKLKRIRDRIGNTIAIIKEENVEKSVDKNVEKSVDKNVNKFKGSK